MPQHYITIICGTQIEVTQLSACVDLSPGRTVLPYTVEPILFQDYISCVQCCACNLRHFRAIVDVARLGEVTCIVTGYTLAHPNLNIALNLQSCLTFTFPTRLPNSEHIQVNIWIPSSMHAHSNSTALATVCNKRIHCVHKVGATTLPEEIQQKNKQTPSTDYAPCAEF